MCLIFFFFLTIINVVGTTPITLLHLIQPLGDSGKGSGGCGGVGGIAHLVGYRSSFALLEFQIASPTACRLPSGMLAIITDLRGGSYNRNSGHLS